MKTTPSRRATVMSSLNETGWGVREKGVTPPAVIPFYNRLLCRYLKTTSTVFVHLGFFTLCADPMPGP
jgi:hypothetical protein